MDYVDDNYYTAVKRDVADPRTVRRDPLPPVVPTDAVTTFVATVQMAVYGMCWACGAPGASKCNTCGFASFCRACYMHPNGGDPCVRNHAMWCNKELVHLMGLRG